MWILLAVGAAFVALSHTWPAPFVLDWAAGDRAVWQMPNSGAPTIYLTYDDGPNPSTTPDLLDALRLEGVPATFFVIDAHLTVETASIVRRAFVEGHSVALHSSTRRFMVMSPAELARTLDAAAERVETLAGSRPCKAFRPHGGWRSGLMYEGLRAIDYRLIGWGWMLWDFNWFRPRSAESTFRRVASRIGDGDIIVMHDGDESAPTSDQRHTIDATRLLIPALRARGFGFGKVC
jgi:peptidoglycan/xylan/chitin deacetylase (PgdA/CDA1 family)